MIDEILLSDEKMPSDVIVFDGFDSALVGWGRVLRDGEMRDVAIYSYERMAESLLEDWIGTENENDDIAVDEHLQHNVLGGYLGPNTPVILIQSWLDVTTPKEH